MIYFIPLLLWFLFNVIILINIIRKTFKYYIIQKDIISEGALKPAISIFFCDFFIKIMKRNDLMILLFFPVVIMGIIMTKFDLDYKLNVLFDAIRKRTHPEEFI